MPLTQKEQKELDVENLVRVLEDFIEAKIIDMRSDSISDALRLSECRQNLVNELLEKL